ncbi:MAG: hypothetical protein ACXIUD_08385 [Mongoliitalea sp.]
MKSIEITMDENKFDETNEICKRIGMTMDEYIFKALTHYNQFQIRKDLEEKLHFESKLVRKKSIKVCKEFDNLS